MSNESSGVWFRQPQDVEFVEHLLNLHFCWIHPFYHFFHREYFLHDMSRGNTEFCSALLVNAICSFACHYSDAPAFVILQRFRRNTSGRRSQQPSTERFLDS